MKNAQTITHLYRNGETKRSKAIIFSCMTKERNKEVFGLRSIRAVGICASAQTNDLKGRLRCRVLADVCAAKNVLICRR